MGIIQTLAAIILSLIILLLWALNGWHSPRTGTETFQTSPAPSTPKPKRLVVASFNASWFYGIGSEGPGYSPKPQSHFQERMNLTSEWIKNHHVDLALFQEVDFNASRSHHENQLTKLSELTGLNYRAQAVSWNVNYLPFPYSPVSHQWGKIVSGGGALSKTPILSQTVQLLKKPDSNFLLYNQFYLFRYLQAVDLGFGLAVNLHLEAFDQINRTEHLQALQSWIEKHRDRIWIISGDFNTPDFRGAHLLPLIRAQDDSKTYPTPSPELRLDHIWYNPKFLKPVRSITGTDLNASDHHPILTEFVVL